MAKYWVSTEHIMIRRSRSPVAQTCSIKSWPSRCYLPDNRHSLDETDTTRVWRDFYDGGDIETCPVDHRD